MTQAFSRNWAGPPTEEAMTACHIWFGNQIEKRHRSNEWAVDMFGLCAAARKSGPGKRDAKYCFDPACVEDMAVSHHLQLLWSHLIYS